MPSKHLCSHHHVASSVPHPVTICHCTSLSLYLTVTVPVSSPSSWESNRRLCFTVTVLHCHCICRLPLVAGEQPQTVLHSLYLTVTVPVATAHRYSQSIHSSQQYTSSVGQNVGCVCGAPRKICGLHKFSKIVAPQSGTHTHTTTPQGPPPTLLPRPWPLATARVRTTSRIYNRGPGDPKGQPPSVPTPASPRGAASPAQGAPSRPRWPDSHPTPASSGALPGAPVSGFNLQLEPP